jgi:TRAP transporter 4TM/12TM fusion protein
VPREECPRLLQVLRDRGHQFIPVVIVLIGMFNDYSAPLAALVGALACFPVALLRHTTREGITWQGFLDAMVDGARNSIGVAMACASAGIMIGVIALTGIGITFTQLVLGLAESSLLMALIVTMLAGLVLGMGLPTTPSYILMVSLLIPAIIGLGVPAPAAHMFGFYFAILSAITPPVALAVFAAAAMAKTDQWTAGWAAMRVGAAGFVVPFMFVYEPALLTIGSWDQIVLASTTASAGCILLAAGLHGYFYRATRLWERAVLIVAAFCLIKPGWITDIVGFGLAALLFAWQYATRERVQAA